MSIEFLVATIYVATTSALVALKVFGWKYKDPSEKALNERLEALEAKTVSVTPEDWEATKNDISSLKMAQGFRNRRS